jgi:hypothetical protein
MIAGGTGFSRVNGPPGIECIIKKVMDAINTIVKNAAIKRLNMYLAK